MSEKTWKKKFISKIFQGSLQNFPALYPYSEPSWQTVNIFAIHYLRTNQKKLNRESFSHRSCKAAKVPKLHLWKTDEENYKQFLVSCSFRSERLMGSPITSRGWELALLHNQECQRFKNYHWTVENAITHQLFPDISPHMAKLWHICNLFQKPCFSSNNYPIKVAKWQGHLKWPFCLQLQQPSWEERWRSNEEVSDSVWKWESDVLAKWDWRNYFWSLRGMEQHLSKKIIEAWSVDIN